MHLSTNSISCDIGACVRLSACACARIACMRATMCVGACINVHVNGNHARLRRRASANIIIR